MLLTVPAALAEVMILQNFESTIETKFCYWEVLLLLKVRIKEHKVNVLVLALTV